MPELKWHEQIGITLLAYLEFYLLFVVLAYMSFAVN